MIEYIEAQLEILLPEEENGDQSRIFAHLLQRFRMIQVPEKTSVNPLLLLAYYDYYGLVCYRNHLHHPSEEMLKTAVQTTETALEHAKRVDMHLQIWSAFLTYNLARFYHALDETEKAVILAVLEKYGNMSGDQLSELTHKELPWKYA